MAVEKSGSLVKTPKKSKKAEKQGKIHGFPREDIAKTPVRTSKKSKNTPGKFAASALETPTQTKVLSSKKSGKKKKAPSISASPTAAPSSAAKDMPFAIFAGGARHTTSELLDAGGPASKSNKSSAKKKQQNQSEDDVKAPASADEVSLPEQPTPLDMDALSTVFTNVVSELEAKINGMATQIKNTQQKLLGRTDFGTGQGVSLLEAKLHLMMDYVASLGALCCLKLEGKSIENHAVVDHLAYLYSGRTCLEKISPMEAKIKYQIDKLVRMSVLGKDGGAAKEERRGADPLSFKPNLGNLAPKLGDDGDAEEEEGKGQKDRGASTGAYVPPRLTAMPYNDDVSVSEKKRDRELKAQARMLNSEMMRELKEEISTTPLEVSHKNDIKSDTAAELKEWEDIEESNFVRISGKRKLLKKQRARMAEDLSGITSFDVTAGLVHATDETSKKRSMRQQMGDVKKRRLSKGRK